MKVRLISAAVAIAILVPLVWVGGIPFAIGMGLLSVLAYKEIVDLKKSHNELPNFVKILGLISVIYMVLGDYKLSSLSLVMSYQRLLLPIVVLLLPTIFYDKNKYTTGDAFYLIGSVYLIGILFNTLISLRSINVYLLLYLVLTSISTDTFAYAVGCLIGKHKMCPSISPKKSWEGAIAGFIGGSIVGIIVYTNLVGDFSIKLLFVTLILSIVGQLGDLVYSKIKRENDIKDFSNIMPGHGGILDRLDSLSFVIFTYILLILFL